MSMVTLDRLGGTVTHTSAAAAAAANPSDGEYTSKGREATPRRGMCE